MAVAETLEHQAVFVLGPVEMERPEKWVDLLDSEHAKHGCHGCEAPVPQSPSDDARLLRSRGTPSFSLIECPELTVLAGILAGASAMLANDSGPAHLAAALGTPTVALFGPTRPEQFAPLGSRVTVLAADDLCDIPVPDVLHAVRTM